MRILFRIDRLLFIVFLVLLVMSNGCSCPAIGQRSDPIADIARHPELWTECGRSVEGRPIVLREQGNRDSVVLVLGSIHGDEEAGGGVVVRLAEALSAETPDSLRRRIVLVPVVNPDGVRARTRWNAHGVDINRNFPTSNWDKGERRGIARHGDSPASEPETQLLMGLIERYRPALIITLHAALHVVNYDGPAKEIAERMGALNGYPVSGSIGYSTPGSLGTYAGVERQIPIITLELPRVGSDEGWQQNRDALLSMVRGQ
jgi:protein MpaA